MEDTPEVDEGVGGHTDVTPRADGSTVSLIEDQVELLCLIEDTFLVHKNQRLAHPISLYEIAVSCIEKFCRSAAMTILQCET